MELRVDRIGKYLQPLVAERAYRMANLGLSPGQTAGFLQSAIGIVNGKPWSQAEFMGHADPPSAGFKLMDSIEIEGYAPVHLFIRPGCNPQLTSAAVTANSLRSVVESGLGLIRVGDLPPAVPPLTSSNRVDFFLKVLGKAGAWGAGVPMAERNTEVLTGLVGRDTGGLPTQPSILSHQRRSLTRPHYPNPGAI